MTLQIEEFQEQMDVCKQCQDPVIWNVPSPVLGLYDQQEMLYVSTFQHSMTCGWLKNENSREILLWLRALYHRILIFIT